MRALWERELEWWKTQRGLTGDSLLLINEKGTKWLRMIKKGGQEEREPRRVLRAYPSRPAAR
ncbi:hypothetical protein KSC_026920 [Ktedonobacter sp. SOSP1-52]|nr:hypothetical protein KSC_026920 [Ktedonobacter sp. SOSP1-52]